MKIHTNTFKTNIKTLGRELDSKITYTIDNEEIVLGNEQLNSVSPHYEGGILKSVMKQLDIDSNVDIPIGTEINYQFGLKVGNAYEYVNYGNYIVYSSEKQEDTRSYKIVAYDKLLYSMVDYEDMSITYPITIRSYLSSICTKLGLTFANASDTFVNYDKTINNELYLDDKGNSLNYTFRDVLDEIAGATASTICINDDDELEIRYINDTNNSSLPKEYREVNYINIPLSGYIDIGFPMSSKYTVEGKVAWASQTGDKFLIGEYPGMMCHAGRTGNYYRIGDTYNWRTTTYQIENNTPFEFKTIMYPNAIAYINGQEIIRQQSTRDFTSQYNGILFAYRYNGTVLTGYGFEGKCYYLKIYDGNNQLLRDYVPCYRINDNVVGLFDLVSNTFFTNSGTGDFTKGDNVINTIDEEFLKDVNVKFGEKYGPVNSVVFSRSAGADNIYRANDSSITTYGLCEIKISDNQILNANNRDEFIDGVFNELEGLEYYINDFSSTGICYYDLCDRYNISVDENTYSCIMLNDEINITQGLEELIHTDLLEESETDYKKADKTDNKINQAYLMVDKQNQQIDAVVQTISQQQTLIDQEGQQIEALGTRITQTSNSLSASITSLQNEFDEGVGLVKTTTVLIDDNGLNVSTDNSKVATTMTTDAFKIVPKGSQDPLAFFGYDSETNSTKAVMDNLTVSNYFVSGYHRTEKMNVNGENRTGQFYIG